jgi:putative membrane protein
MAGLNAILNALSAVLLILGFAAIRRRDIESHRRYMLAAFSCSILFLVSYLVYHFRVGSVKFQGVGPIRYLYFSILLSHTVLASLVPFLASITLFRALKERIPQHRKIARWTLPIWLYVSVTGVLVYLMLYHL